MQRMELFNITCVKSEVTVKQEEDWAEEYGTQTNDEQNKKSTSDDKGNLLPVKFEVKFEVESDDENNTKPVLDNVQCDNSLKSSDSAEYINVYDDVLDIVKVEIAETLDSVESKTAGESNNGRNQASICGDIPYSQSLGSRKRVKLNDGTGRQPKLKAKKLMTLEHLSGNTDPAAALHIEGSTLLCPHCKFKTTKKKSLKAHSRIHSTEKPFICDKCYFVCPSQYSLKQHNNQKHMGEKPFACDKCNFKCKLKGSMKRHLLTHYAGQKPFSCDMCDYKCKRKDEIKRHLLTHTGEKPFPCHKCNFRCAQKGPLKQHLLTHTDQKPFACDECSYKCRRKSDMTRHSLIHACHKLFCCDKCGYKCNRRDIMNKHLLIH